MPDQLGRRSSSLAALLFDPPRALLGEGDQRSWWRGLPLACNTPPPSFGRSPSPSELGEDIGARVLYLIIKAAISGAIVAIVSEVARRYPGWGGLLASLPLTSLLAMIWLWRDSHEPEKVAELTASTFWFILPSLPMFLVLPWMFRSGIAFWLALAISVAGTLALYAIWFWAAPRMGIKL